MKLLRRFINWLRPKMAYLNIGLALGAYIANQYFIQGFCQPVTWAAWVLGLSVGAFLVWPWLKHVPQFNYLLLFLQGALLPVCIYCTAFASSYLLMTLLFGFLVLPLLMWTPVVFLVQVVKRAWTNSLPMGRWVFGAGVLPLLLAQGWAWGQYQQVVAAVKALPPSQRGQVGPLLHVAPRTYMAERLAGLLFKYHDLPEMIYDGWRPPLHDPLLNVCLWSNRWVMHDDDYFTPLIIRHWMLATKYYSGYWASDINDQAAFYHALFPDMPVKADCGCNVSGGGYYAWKPGLTDNNGTPLVEVERYQKEFDAEMSRTQAKISADSARASHSRGRP